MNNEIDLNKYLETRKALNLNDYDFGIYIYGALILAQHKIDKAIEYIEARHIKAQVELTDREKHLLDILRGEKDENN